MSTSVMIICWNGVSVISLILQTPSSKPMDISQLNGTNGRGTDSEHFLCGLNCPGDLHCISTGPPLIYIWSGPSHSRNKEKTEKPNRYC